MHLQRGHSRLRGAPLLRRRRALHRLVAVRLCGGLGVGAGCGRRRLVLLLRICRRLLYLPTCTPQTSHECSQSGQQRTPTACCINLTAGIAVCSSVCADNCAQNPLTPRTCPVEMAVSSSATEAAS